MKRGREGGGPAHRLSLHPHAAIATPGIQLWVESVDEEIPSHRGADALHLLGTMLPFPPRIYK